MSISVEVSLLSGKTAIVEAGLGETVETLAQRAQIALGVGKDQPRKPGCRMVIRWPCM